MSDRTLMMRLAGPMQSWGTSSRFTRRATDYAPSKSGVLGMLAAAKGIRRTEPLTDLLGLRFGVRVDQPGQMMRDFQTSRPLDRDGHASLAERFYLADAVFLAVVEGDAVLIDGLAEALTRPHFLPYLGRRSCPPSAKVLIGTTGRPLAKVLREHEWLAARHHRVRFTGDGLQTVRDAALGEAGDQVQDEPESYDPRHRKYRWRRVVRDTVPIPGQVNARTTGHDPFAFFEA